MSKHEVKSMELVGDRMSRLCGTALSVTSIRTIEAGPRHLRIISKIVHLASLLHFGAMVEDHDH